MTDCPNEKAAGSKPDISLVAPDFILAVAEVMTNGRGTHGARQWEEGMAWSLAYNSLMRHMLAWASGQDKDPKSGYSHLAHAACRIMMLLCYEQRGLGTDDRKRLSKKHKWDFSKSVQENILAATREGNRTDEIAPLEAGAVYHALPRRGFLPDTLTRGDYLVRFEESAPHIMKYKILGEKGRNPFNHTYYVRDPHDSTGIVEVSLRNPQEFDIIGYIRS